MHASAQSVLYRAAAPILSAAEFRGEGYRIGRQRANGPASLTRAVSIAGAKSGAVEADHSQ